MTNRSPARPGVPEELTEEDIRKLVEVFRILDRWKREDDERAAAEQVGQLPSSATAQETGEGPRL